MKFPVSESKYQSLLRRMQKLNLHEGDIQEQFVRSRGPGGQNLNKVSTCVVLVHSQSGIRIKCQSTRSQAMNRFLARRLLCDKLETMMAGKKSAAEKKRFKLRKQKKRRSRKTKEKLLELKRQRKEKKERRQQIDHRRHD